MNYSYLESRSKEKISNRRNEGMKSQAHYRSGASKATFLSKLPKLILFILIVLGLAQVIFR